LLKIESPLAPAQKIIGIYRYPEENKINPSYYDDTDDKLLNAAKLIKGSNIDPIKWNNQLNGVKLLQAKLQQIISPINVTDSVKNYNISIITIKELSQYKGIDLIRLLKGIFSYANITLGDTDQVVVKDHKYFSLLTSVISSQKKE